jgi:hypothetical protein
MPALYPKLMNNKTEIKGLLSDINSFMPITGDIQSGLLAANDIKNGNYGSAALNAAGLLPFVPSLAGTLGGKSAKLAEALKKKTKYELAHEVAQKNAVDMLGLPPNNTAMDRAQAMGFDNKTYYHGTNAEIKAFDPEKSAQGGITWIADTPNYANEYTMNASQGAGNILPLKANMGKTAGWKEYDQLGLDELSGRGFNSTWLPESNAESVGFVMNPNQLRSINAAFDPARAHEADLLGYSTPEMLGLLALGSGAGVGYMASKKDNRK